MDNNNQFGNNNQNDNENHLQNISGNPFINNYNTPNQFYGQNIPDNNYIPPQNNYNEPFNRQYVNTTSKKSSKGIYILLITVLICFAVIIFLMLTVMRSMIDGGDKKSDDNNIILSENVITTEVQTETPTASPVTTAVPVEKVTEIVTVIVEVTAPPVTEAVIQIPSFDSYTYAVNNYNLPVYAKAEYSSDVLGHITDRGNYTVIDQSGRWANLSSGGWINLDEASENGYLYYIGKGYISTQKDPLNIRYAPTADAKILTGIPKNTSVDVYETYFSDWYYTEYNGKSGFVSAKYITMGNPPTVSVEAYYGYGTVATEKDPLNVRSEPSINASIVTSIPKGTSIELCSTSEAGWYYTTYNGKSGFVKSDYISFIPVYESYAPLTAVINTKNDPLNIRETASKDGKIITAIPKGTTVTIIDYDGNWCYIQWGEYTGYASTEYLAFGQ